MSQKETSTKDTTIIPRNFTAINLIIEAIKLKSKLNLATIQISTEQGVVYILLKNNKSDRDGLAIWYNGPDFLISGGRSVEAGNGPYYYETFGELKSSIENGINYRESLN
jgi:hypothetical protein